MDYASLQIFLYWYTCIKYLYMYMCDFDFFSSFFFFIYRNWWGSSRQRHSWIREKTMEGPLNLWGPEYYLPNWTLEYS